MKDPRCVQLPGSNAMVGRFTSACSIWTLIDLLLGVIWLLVEDYREYRGAELLKVKYGNREVLERLSN